MGIKNCLLEFDSSNSVYMTALCGHNIKFHEYLVRVTSLKPGRSSVSYAGYVYSKVTKKESFPLVHSFIDDEELPRMTRMYEFAYLKKTKIFLKAVKTKYPR